MIFWSEVRNYSYEISQGYISTKCTYLLSLEIKVLHNDNFVNRSFKNNIHMKFPK